MRYDFGKKAWKQAGAVAREFAEAKALVSQLGGVPVVGARNVMPQQPAKGARGSAGRAISVSRPLREVVSDMAFSSKEWYAATTSGLLVSTDRGETWTGMPVGPVASLPVQSVCVSSNGEMIRVVSLRGLLFSDDGGNSWTWHDLPLKSGGAVTLYAQPGDENTLVAIARNGLYISRDAGETWQQAASGLPATPVQDFAANGGVFVASMRTGGLYVSSDSGQTWDRVTGPLADGLFAAVAASNKPGVIFAASKTEGLYKVEWPGPTASGTGTQGRFGKQAARGEGSPGD
jgi:photosystem II stability/assembly factor-like uncharacterized protein